MSAKKYTPIEGSVDAYKLTADNGHEVMEWMRSLGAKAVEVTHEYDAEHPDGKVAVATWEPSYCSADQGEFVIHEGGGKFRKMDADGFATRFREA